MKYRATALPAPAKGVSIKNKGGKLTVPDSAMSLEEILRRFTRNEAVPVGRTPVYHESGDDLDKIAHADLTEQAEFIERQKETQREFDRQEKRKASARRKKLEEEERSKIREELAKSAPPARGPAEGQS